ncbi:MAG: tetratricopeptide repeat protein [Myxococcota bacterium]
MKPRTIPTSLVLACATVWAAACGEPLTTPSAEPDKTHRAEPAPTDTAALAALAYAPDDSATGRRIAAAQAELRAQPDRIEAHLALATLLMRRQRETSNAVLMRYAQDVVDAARARAPEDPQVLLMHAMILQDGHRFSRASEVATEVLAMDPNNATAHLVRADAQLELGDYEGAMDSVQAALDLHPDLRSYNRAAHLRWLLGDFDSALAIMELALDSGSPRDPESSAWCFVDLGMMFLHRGDGVRARASAERALRLVPDYLPAQILEARALHRTGRPAEAIEQLTGVVDRKPLVEELLRLAEWHETAGDAEAAGQRRAQADRLASDDPRPLALDLARRGVQTERAVALAREELSARTNIAAHDTLAVALARAGEHDSAWASMERALAMGTTDANLHLHAALVHALAGRSTQAREALARAEQIDAAADPRVSDELRRRLGDA